jgi:hypothetical protein
MVSDDSARECVKMSKPVHYRQCRVRRSQGSGTYSEQVPYLPEAYCTRRRVLRLRDADGNWTDGWVINDSGEAVFGE